MAANGLSWNSARLVAEENSSGWRFGILSFPGLVLSSTSAGVILSLGRQLLSCRRALRHQEVAMRIARLASPLFSILAFACFALSCGSSRQLQSITVSQTTSGTQATFVATGTFSAAPTTVTPLPVSWYVGAVGAQYTLTTQPFSATIGCLD